MVLEVITVFAILAIIIFLGFLSELIFNKTKIPDVFFLILIGIIIGPILGYVTPETFANEAGFFTTFTLMFLLFQGAINIEFREMFDSLKGTLKLTIISFIFSLAIIIFISMVLLSYSFGIALLLAIILGGICSAVVVPLLSHLQLDKKYASILTLESAITDVLCIVGVISTIAIITTGNVTIPEITKAILSSFSLAIVIGVVIGLIWIFLLAKSTLLRNSYMVTIALVMAIYAFVESSYVGASGAIAALSFGLILGNSASILSLYSKTYKNKQENLIEESVLSENATSFYYEISFFLKIFFFIYLGILIDLTKPFILFYGLLMTIGLFLVRNPAVKISFYKENVDKRSYLALKALAPRGLAAAVLAQLAISKGINNAQEMSMIVFAVIFISIIFTSVMLFIGNRKIRKEEEKFKQSQLIKPISIKKK